MVLDPVYNARQLSEWVKDARRRTLGYPAPALTGTGAAGQ